MAVLPLVMKIADVARRTIYVMVMRTALLSLVLCSVAFAQPAQVRVGVYDSRVVAYAHFWSPAVQQEHAAVLARAREAKARGDGARFDELSASMRAEQNRTHYELFSAMPTTAAMCAIKERLPSLQRQLGVARIVSKWDGYALENVAASDRVDVTDVLVREFLPQPTEKQRKAIESIKRAKPIPMWQVRVLSLLGAL